MKVLHSLQARVRRFGAHLIGSTRRAGIGRFSGAATVLRARYYVHALGDSRYAQALLNRADYRNDVDGQEVRPWITSAVHIVRSNGPGSTTAKMSTII